MLKKLLKYDFKDIFKVLKIFYILAIFFAILTRIFLNIEKSFILNIIGQVCSGVTISMIFNVLINNLIKLWHSFKSTLYGDEAYLTHTLPVKKSTIYLSKVISSIITLAVSIVIIGITLFIAYYSKENMETVKSILLPVANVYNSSIMMILIAFLFIFFLEFANALQAGYCGIILGHKMNNAKTGYSILFGFITYIMYQIFAVLCMFIIALFNKDIMNLFYTTVIIDISIVKILIYISMAIYSAMLMVGYAINLKLFKKGVNIE